MTIHEFVHTFSVPVKHPLPLNHAQQLPTPHIQQTFPLSHTQHPWPIVDHTEKLSPPGQPHKADSPSPQPYTSFPDLSTTHIIPSPLQPCTSSHSLFNHTYVTHPPSTIYIIHLLLTTHITPSLHPYPHLVLSTIHPPPPVLSSSHITRPLSHTQRAGRDIYTAAVNLQCLRGPRHDTSTTWVPGVECHSATPLRTTNYSPSVTFRVL